MKILSAAISSIAVTPFSACRARDRGWGTSLQSKEELRQEITIRRWCSRQWSWRHRQMQSSDINYHESKVKSRQESSAFRKGCLPADNVPIRWKVRRTDVLKLDYPAGKKLSICQAMCNKKECADVVRIAEFEGVKWSGSIIPLKTEALHLSRTKNCPNSLRCDGISRHLESHVYWQMLTLGHQFLIILQVQH